MGKGKIKGILLRRLNSLLAILFGVVALFFPSVTIMGLSVYFAIAILSGGLFLVIGGLRKQAGDGDRMLSFIEGAIGIILGLIVLAKPGEAAAVFILLVGIWAIFQGIFFLTLFFRASRSGFVVNFLLVAGSVSLLLGLLIAFNPFESTRVITVLIGIYAILYGIFSMMNRNNYVNKS